MTNRSEIECLIINGRTPEEIKIGLRNMLETCADISGIKDTVCQEMCCPYDNDNCCHETILMGALALIQHLEAQQPKWISVKERLPENFKSVIILRDDVPNGGLMEIGWRIGKYWSVPNGVNVTHWMPLPEPPEETNEHGRTKD